MRKIVLFLALATVLSLAFSAVAFAGPMYDCNRCQKDTKHIQACGADSTRVDFGTHKTICDYYTQRKYIKATCSQCKLVKSNTGTHPHTQVHSEEANKNVCNI